MSASESISPGDLPTPGSTRKENDDADGAAPTMQEDNPCWGSPTECSLSHMIVHYPKESCLVYESPYYVVLNKPPDLRMDGPYPATVHKLLTLWYPPPSIANDPHLEATISTLHQHNSLEDNALRPCHQLDYATSGLLCVARTREAARFAVRQWEQRKVLKTYLAVVEADLMESHGETLLQNKNIPKLTSAQIRSTLQRLESNYKKTKTPDLKKRSTFQGFQPVHAVYQKYKGKTISANKSTLKNKKRPRPDLLTPEQWDHVWEPVESALSEGQHDTSVSQDNMKLISSSDWKAIERSKPEWKSAFLEATERHNNFLRDATRKQEEESATIFTLPTIFGELSEEGHPSNIIYISCPLAVDPESFPMKTPPSVVPLFPHMKHFTGDPQLDYKPSLTKCTILNSVERNGRTCTKVELLPLTGRRHQLRVHMALLAGHGYGIVGDATYNQHTSPLSELRKNDKAARPERMCLHSHRLSLSLLVDDASEKGEPVNLLAPDPF